MLIASHFRCFAVVASLMILATGGTAVAAKTAPKNSVTSKSIKNGQVKSSDLASGAVSGANIKANSVTGSQIDELTLDFATLQKRVAGTCTGGQAIGSIAQDGTVNCVSVGGTSGWSLTGNAGTTPGTNFIGTTDDKAFEVKVNGQQALRLEPAAGSPNLIAGYSGNSVDPRVVGATIAGGGSAPDSGNSPINTIDSNFGSIGGGYGNTAGSNEEGGDLGNATVGGGANNTASAEGAVVAGGESNLARDFVSSVGGGDANQATGLESAIPGGFGNHATGDYSFAAGNRNTASGEYSSVTGGQNNTASGQLSTVAGGQNDTAAGVASFAAGAHASIPAADDGTFAFSDVSNNNPFDPGGKNRFSVRSAGGAYFVTATNPTTGAGTAGVFVAPGGGSWSSLSDRHSKTNIEKISPRAVLRKLSAVPVHTWSYKTQDSSIRHMGPMAQTFGRAFGLGEDRKHIDDIDAQGVALTAVKGAALKIRSQHRQLIKQRAANRRQNARIAALESEVGAR